MRFSSRVSITPTKYDGTTPPDADGEAALPLSRLRLAQMGAGARRSRRPRRPSGRSPNGQAIRTRNGKGYRPARSPTIDLGAKSRPVDRWSAPQVGPPSIVEPRAQHQPQNGLVARDPLSHPVCLEIGVVD